jgi:hypothetical protein
MKNIRTESGIRIYLPDCAYIEIWESCGDWLIDINDSGKSVQIKTEHDENGKSFHYYNDFCKKRPNLTDARKVVESK